MMIVTVTCARFTKYGLGDEMIRQALTKAGYQITENNINAEENNQQNALIVSLINLLISNYSNMFRPLS
jgi:hypothetical protein